MAAEKPGFGAFSGPVAPPRGHAALVGRGLVTLGWVLVFGIAHQSRLKSSQGETTADGQEAKHVSGFGKRETKCFSLSGFGTKACLCLGALS